MLLCCYAASLEEIFRRSGGDLARPHCCWASQPRVTAGARMGHLHVAVHAPAIALF